MDLQAGVIRSALGCPDSVCIIACQSVDLDGDGSIETVVLTSENVQDGHPVGGSIYVLTECDGELEHVWDQDGLNPWKLEIGDVDNDGLKEIVVGVWKESPFDPVMANRPFVYNWDGEVLKPKWLGSRLSRRFDDFVLYDINSDDWDELIALEISDGDMHRIAVYRWDIFGFEWLGCSEGMTGIIGFSEDENGLAVVTLSGQIKIEFLEDHVEFKPLDQEERDVRKNQSENSI